MLYDATASEKFAKEMLTGYIKQIEQLNDKNSGYMIEIGAVNLSHNERCLN